MNVRHASALALVGWILWISGGKTIPEDCDHCAVTLESEGHASPAQYGSKELCERAAAAYRRRFEQDLKINHEYAGTPLETKCVEAQE